MMRRVTTTLLLSITCWVSAETFEVGGQEVFIPSPQGFSRVTQNMDGLYRMISQNADPVNDQLAFYISESDVPAAMAGEIPPVERNFQLKVTRKVKNVVWSSRDFAELKRLYVSQNYEIIDSVRSKMSDSLERTSERIGDEFDIDLAIQISNVIPLDPHYEAEDALAYSMYINYGVSSDGTEEEVIVSVTNTLVNVSGKVVLLYCFGPKDDLEWTRSASRAWAEAVMASNAQPPVQSSLDRGNVSDTIIIRAFYGGIAGGLSVLIIVVISSIRKRLSPRSVEGLPRRPPKLPDLPP